MNNSYSKFDFSALQTVVEKYRQQAQSNPHTSQKVNFAQHKEKFVKVAWDLWRLKDEPEMKIWQLDEPDEHGVQYINRVTSFADDDKEEKTSSWSAHEDKENKEITVSYKKIPLAKLAVEDFGVPTEDINIFKKTIVEQLKNHDNVKALLNSLDENYRANILANFPELS